jgi:uncharacterized membrane protein
MSYKTYRLWKAVVTAIVAVLVAWSVLNGNALIPIPTVIAGVVIIYLFHRGVKEVVVDERVYSVRIFGTLAATTGATLIALSRGGSPDVGQAGFTLVYAACAIIVIYYIAFIYYNRKLGGR